MTRKDFFGNSDCFEKPLADAPHFFRILKIGVQRWTQHTEVCFLISLLAMNNGLVTESVFSFMWQCLNKSERQINVTF